MAVYYALVNNIIMDCGIAEINPDHDNGKDYYPQIWLIPDEACMIIRMDETIMVAEQSKDMDQPKGVCAKGEGGSSTKKIRRVLMVVCCSLLQGRTVGVEYPACPCSCLTGEAPCRCTG